MDMLKPTDEEKQKWAKLVDKILVEDEAAAAQVAAQDPAKEVRMLC